MNDEKEKRRLAYYGKHKKRIRLPHKDKVLTPYKRKQKVEGETWPE